MSRHVSLRAPKIHALTSLRFFAALLVVLYHTIWFEFTSLTHSSLLGRFFDLGLTAVSFFYLLSGYILAVVYLRSNQSLHTSAFYAARFARVYPLFFLTLILDTPNLLMQRIAQYGWSSALLKTSITFAGNLVMLQAWPLRLRGIDNPNWSLSVETLFYLMFPFVAVWLWKLEKSRIWICAACLWIGGQLLVLLVTPYTVADYAKFFPPLHVSTFLLGILLAKLRFDKGQSGGIKQVPKRRSLLLLSLALIAFGFVVYWELVIPQGNLSDGLLAPIFACVIWVFSDNESLPAKLLSAKWMVLLGEASFGLYLIHLPVYHLFERLHLSYVTALYPIYLAICIGLSILSFYFIETPSRKWILRHLHARTKETMEAASDAQ